MADRIHILGISGSLRKGSHNTALLHAARELAGVGAEMEILDIGSLPLYNKDLEDNMPASAKELKAKIAAADGMLFVTPEYNYSFSGVLKNAIDWASRPYGDNSFAGKPAGIMSASTGMLGGARAQYQLRQTFVTLNIHPLNEPEVMVPFAAKKFNEAGVLTDEETRTRVEAFMAALTVWAGRFKTNTL